VGSADTAHDEQDDGESPPRIWHASRPGRGDGRSLRARGTCRWPHRTSADVRAGQPVRLRAVRQCRPRRACRAAADQCCPGSGRLGTEPGASHLPVTAQGTSGLRPAVNCAGWPPPGSQSAAVISGDQATGDQRHDQAPPQACRESARRQSNLICCSCADQRQAARDDANKVDIESGEIRHLWSRSYHSAA